MSLFGEKLTEIIDSNNINIYQLAQRAGVERTAIHKAKAGKHIPDADYVRKLAAAMPVSPGEKEDLLTAWKISKDGEFLHNQRIQVRQLIERMSWSARLPESGREQPPLSVDVTLSVSSESKQAEDGSDCAKARVANGTLAINAQIDDMLARELQAAKPGVKFVMPPSYAFFYDNLFLKCRKAPALKVECAFEFCKNAVLSQSKRNANLDAMNALAPFIMDSGDFAAYFAYSSQPLSSLPLLAMPWFIVTSSEVATLAADLQNAVFFSGQEAVDCYGKIFAGIKEKGQPLVKLLSTMEETTEFYAAHPLRCGGIAGFGSHPCIGVYYDMPLIEAHLLAGEQMFAGGGGDIASPQAQWRREVVKAWHGTFEGFRAAINAGEAFSYFAKGGLELFAEKGVLQTIAENFFSPLAPSERTEIIKKMIADAESGRISYRLLDQARLSIPACFYADVFKDSHINIVVGGDGEHTRTIHIYEESIIAAFYDFLANGSMEELACSKEETLEALESALERTRGL